MQQFPQSILKKFIPPWTSILQNEGDKIYFKKNLDISLQFFNFVELQEKANEKF